MYINNSGVIPEAIQSAFAKSLEIYPSSFKPDLRIVDGYYPGTARCNLPLEMKAMLFHAYCAEHNKEGRIVTSDWKKEDIVLSNGARGWFVTVTAEIYIDGNLRGSAIAGQQCLLDNLQELDSIVQMASGLAKSRALSNAGFGIISGSDFDASGANQAPVQHPAPAQPPVKMPAQQNPVAPPAANGKAPTTTPFDDPSSPGNNQPPAGSNQMVINASFAAQPSNSAADPIAAAKAVVCDMNGPSVKGKTMGEILATDPSKIIYMAEKWKKECPTKEAARVLLPEAQKIAGVKR